MGSKSGLGAMLVAGFPPSTILAKLPYWISVHEHFRSQEQSRTHEVLSAPVWFSLATSTVSLHCKQSSNHLPSCHKSPTETDRLLPPSSFSLYPYQHNTKAPPQEDFEQGFSPSTSSCWCFWLTGLLIFGKASLLYYQSGICTLFNVSKVLACVLRSISLQMPTAKDVQNLLC